MRMNRLALALALGFPLLGAAHASPTDTAAAGLAPDALPADTGADAGTPARSLGIVTIRGQAPTVFPGQVPATMDGIDRVHIEQTLNASDAEDALKYLPGLLVRKRYVGDYNHAILSSRASGTGNSARSAVYADGLLLSNYLGNGVGGLSFPPRWGLVSPGEIERVDVMYGPFSAAAPGNSVGAVVAYTTRLPEKFEAGAHYGISTQPNDQYGHTGTYDAWEAGASVGGRAGALAWRLSLDHTESHGQPLTFATRLVSAGVAGNAGTVVTGAVPGQNNQGKDWLQIGSGTEYQTQQDQFKARARWAITPTLDAHAVLALWTNQSSNTPRTWLRDAAGNPVWSGAVNIGGLAFTGSQALSGADFAMTREDLLHRLGGLILKSHTQGTFDWEATLGQMAYVQDRKRQNAAGNPLPLAASGGAGTLAQGDGSGWVNVGLKGTWRPDAQQVIDLGVQQDDYRLRYRTFTLASDWLGEHVSAQTPLASQVQGRTVLRSVFVQDVLRLGEAWRLVAGLRGEQWQAVDGRTDFSAASAQAWPTRTQRFASPKLALSWQPAAEWVLKGALGRAVRMPTVSELYGATSTTNSTVINEPGLRPERSWTSELSAERDLGTGLLRATLFTENTRDAIYSQTVYDATVNKNISRVQNVGRIHTQGAEIAGQMDDLLVAGFDLLGSVTWADSVIRENGGFVSAAGDTLGKRQPNIPLWRAALQGNWRFTPGWNASLGARYSGRQYRTLNNSDVHGDTYMGVSPFLTVDARVRWQINRQWAAALGVDNLNNNAYWNFHPYPQRTWTADVKFNL